MTLRVNGVGLQRAVRNYTQVQTKLPDPPKVEVPLPGEGGEAFLAWGGTSSFSTAVSGAAGATDFHAVSGGGVIVTPLKKQPETIAGGADQPHPNTAASTGAKQARDRKAQGQDRQPGVIALDMIDAKYETGKIYSPDDKDVWVKETRMTSVRFRGSVPMISTDAQGNQTVRNAPVIYKMNIKHPPWPRPPKGD
jgi:hypothetical protein